MIGPSRPFLRVQGVSKIFAAAGGATVALNDIELDVARGSFVSIVGPSGCGKSHCFRLSPA
jgi:ABC-type nitrate/sulfonate/bicarbonate transport system ATPase subunit